MTLGLGREQTANRAVHKRILIHRRAIGRRHLHQTDVLFLVLLQLLVLEFAIVDHLLGVLHREAARRSDHSADLDEQCAPEALCIALGAGAAALEALRVRIVLVAFTLQSMALALELRHVVLDTLALEQGELELIAQGNVGLTKVVVAGSIQGELQEGAVRACILR